MNYKVELHLIMGNTNGAEVGKFIKEVELSFVPYNGLLYNISVLNWAFRMSQVEWTEHTQKFLVDLDDEEFNVGTFDPESLKKDGWEFEGE